MNKLCYLFMLLSVSGCFSRAIKMDDPPIKLHYKEITTPYFKLDWYFHSTITSIIGDYVTVTKDGKCDTICLSTNIIDINVHDSIINISFNNAPKWNNEPAMVTCPYYCSLVIDTQQLEGAKPYRPFYKDEK